jgi:glycosyltransferase involved in cell wall biosynthesis
MWFFAKNYSPAMTIAIISMIRDSWGGSEELWYAMTKEALKDGHIVIHLRYDTPEIHPKLKELIALGLVSYKRPGWIPANASKILRTTYIAYNFIRKKIKDPFFPVFKHRPDVVLYNGTCYSIAQEKSLLNNLNSDKHTRFFIIGHLNNDFMRTITNQEAKIVSTAYKLCQKVFFVSKRNLQTAERHLATSIKNAAIIRNPVNLSDTTAIPLPAINGCINFALVGNLVTIHKGQDIIFSALGSEDWIERNWNLNIYGTGPDETYLKSLSKHLKIDDKVFFHGTVTDIRKVWNKNHVLLMPSLMEGMPLAIVEAMLCSRVCIATDVGGHKEWITDGISGFIAEAPTVFSFQKGMERAWNRKEDWDTIGMQARQSALQLYDQNSGTSLLNEIVNG